MNDLMRELSCASEAAKRAGQVLLERFRTGLQVERKAGNEPVTEADRASERVVIEGLQAQFPDDGYLSEEQPDHASYVEHRRAWVIDPLDGTKDYVAGREGFSVMIGLLVDHRPVLGVVHQPLTGSTYRGVCFEAVRLAEVEEKGTMTPLLPSSRRSQDGLRLISSYSHRSPRIDEAKKRLNIVDEGTIGSVGVKIGLIARGERELYLNPDGHCKLWDICAPEAILLAAGGCFTDLHGAPLVYDDPTQMRPRHGLVATNGHCHDEILKGIRALADA
jgi:3'(2'), 5'-bisphosphate nucleotidase